MNERQTIIQDKVFKDVEEIYSYIKENSIQNAENMTYEDNFLIISIAKVLFIILLIQSKQSKKFQEF